MDVFTASEYGYKNGYEAGKKDAIVHGQWLICKEISKDEEFPVVYIRCSVCNKIEFKRTPYCSECGAKMDLQQGLKRR